MQDRPTLKEKVLEFEPGTESYHMFLNSSDRSLAKLSAYERNVVCISDET